MFSLTRSEVLNTPDSVTKLRSKQQKVLLLSHSTDKPGNSVLENLRTSLEFSKIEFEIFDVAGKQTWPNMLDFSCIVLCTTKISALPINGVSAIREHVSKGYGLLVAIRGWNQNLSKIFGVPSEQPKFGHGGGIIFHEDVFPGTKDLSSSVFFKSHSAFDVHKDQLSNDCTVLASNLEGLPILWSRPVKYGHVVYWNTNHLSNRKMRGFFIHSLLLAMGTGFASKEEFAVLQIDDFPASLSDSEIDPIKDEYPDRSWNEFIFKDWYQDMISMRAKHNLKYTWYTIMNYHDIATDENSLRSPEEKTFDEHVLQTRLKRMQSLCGGDEIAFHGYNHVTMTSDQWPDKNILKQKLIYARELWEKNFQGDMPTSWVPANNQYHQDHIKVLKEVFPEIKLVCGNYSSGDFSKGQFREFDIEPWESGIDCMPRETSGYIFTDELKLMTVSQIASMGVWTHFIHPDDIFDVPINENDDLFRRNQDQLLWRAQNETGAQGMFNQFEEWIAYVRTNFPWLEFLTTSQAHSKLSAYKNKRVEIARLDSTFEIRSSDSTKLYIKVKLGEELEALTNCSIHDEVDVFGGKLYSVRCGTGLATLNVLKTVSSTSFVSQMDKNLNQEQLPFSLLEELYDKGEYVKLLDILEIQKTPELTDQDQKTIIIAALSHLEDWDNLIRALKLFLDRKWDMSRVITHVTSKVGHLVSEGEYYYAQNLIDILLSVCENDHELRLHAARLQYDTNDFNACLSMLHQIPSERRLGEYYGSLEIAAYCKLEDWERVAASLRQHFCPSTDMDWVIALLVASITTLINNHDYGPANLLILTWEEKGIYNSKFCFAKFKLQVETGDRKKLLSRFKKGRESRALEFDSLELRYILALALDKTDEIKTILFELYQKGELTQSLELLYLETVNMKFEQGKVDEATTLLSQNLIDKIKSPYRYFLLARQSYENGNYTVAIAYCSIASTEDVGDKRAIGALENACYAKLQQWDKVIGFIEKNYTPGPMTNWSVAQSIIEASKVEKATILEQLVLQKYRNSENFNTQIHLANTLINAGCVDLIIENLKDEFAQHSSSPFFCSMYVDAIYANRRWAKFEDDIDKMIAEGTVDNRCLSKIEHIKSGLKFVKRHSSIRHDEIDFRIMDGLLEGIFSRRKKLSYWGKKNKVSLVGANMAAGGAEHVLINAHRELLTRHKVDNYLWLHDIEKSRKCDHYLKQYKLDADVSSHKISMIEREEKRVQALELLPTYIGTHSNSIYKKILRERPSVLHAWQDSTNIECAIAGIIAGIPKIILHPHNMRPDLVHKTEITKSLRSGYRALLKRKDIYLVCCSEASLKDYLNWLDIERTKNCFVVYNGFDWFGDSEWSERKKFSANYFTQKLGIDPTHKIVSGVFRLNEIKQPMLWLDVAKEVIRTQDGVSFVMFGDGEYRNQVDEYIKKNGLTRRIYAPGIVQNASLHSASAIINLHTSRSEGLPTVLIEAMANGASVVASNVGGSAECFCGDHVGMFSLVDDLKKETFVNEVTRQLKEKYSENDRMELSRKTRLKFGAKNMTNQLLDIYNYNHSIRG